MVRLSLSLHLRVILLLALLLFHCILDRLKMGHMPVTLTLVLLLAKQLEGRAERALNLQQFVFANFHFTGLLDARRACFFFTC